MIGIYGYGFVGQAVHSAMRAGLDVLINDPDKGYVDDIKKADVIFVCLPTPTVNGKIDNSILNSALNFLLDFSGLIIIKSTTTSINQNILNLKQVVYNPEFLNQNSASEDFKTQENIILGGKVDHCRVAKDIYENYFDFEHDIDYTYCSVEEAINIKYTHNIYHAYKALFWNYVQEITGNARFYSSIYKKVIKRANEMSSIYADGKPGVGGACFPKDMIAYHDKHDHGLTAFMIAYNTTLRPDEMKDKL